VYWLIVAFQIVAIGAAWWTWRRPPI
jgi:hypothetical protein